MTQTSESVNRIFELTQENKKLQQHIISITLSHEELLQENSRLKDLNKCQKTEIVEKKLSIENLQFTQIHLKDQYKQLQSDYQNLYDHLHSQHKISLRKVFQAQSQKQIDLTLIERESFREEQSKLKHRQLQYVSECSRLKKLNSELNRSMLDSTTHYQNQLFDLKSQNAKLEARLTVIDKLYKQNLTNLQSSVALNRNSTQSVALLEDANETQILNSKIIKDLQSANMQLYDQTQELNDRLSQKNREIESLNKKINSLESQSSLHKDMDIKYVRETAEQNIRLQKELEESNQERLILFNEYPEIAENQENIMNFMLEFHKLQNLKQIQSECELLKSQLEEQKEVAQNFENSYFEIEKEKHQNEYLYCTVLKRLNEVFITMNPYFEIHHYTQIEFNEHESAFFSQRKDYLSVKEYEAKIKNLSVAMSNLKQSSQAEIQSVQEENKRLLNALMLTQRELQDLKKQLTAISQVNKLLKQQMEEGVTADDKNVAEEQQGANNESKSVRKENNTVNEPEPTKISKSQVFLRKATTKALWSLVHQLQNDREILLEIAQQKDSKIVELQNEVYKLSHRIDTRVIRVDEPIKFSILQSSEKINNNQMVQSESQKMLRDQIEDLKRELNSQSDRFELEVKEFQTARKEEIKELNQSLTVWMEKYQLAKEQLLSVHTQNANVAPGNSVIQEENLASQASEQRHAESRNEMVEEEPEQELEEAAVFGNLASNQEMNGSKLTGINTVQNLTQTLKQYQSEMSDLLSVCTKLSVDYHQIKERLKNQEELETLSRGLKTKLDLLEQEYTISKAQCKAAKEAYISLQRQSSQKETQAKEGQAKSQSQRKKLEGDIQALQSQNQSLKKEITEIKENVLSKIANQQQSAEVSSSMGKNEFETIVVMHANKNAEINQLQKKNLDLESKIQNLEAEMHRSMRQSGTVLRNSSSQSALEQEQRKIINDLIKEGGIFKLLKEANQIVEEQQRLKLSAKREKQKSSQKSDSILGEDEEHKSNSQGAVQREEDSASKLNEQEQQKESE